jgi:hypothetical protein
VAAVLRSGTPWTLDSPVKELDGPAYWETIKHKDKNGKPLEDSWLMQDAGGVRRSVMYHLNGLWKDGLVVCPRNRVQAELSYRCRPDPQ